MKKLALLLAVLMTVCSFSALTVMADGLFVSAGTVTLPTEGDADSMLIGWTYKNGEDTVILAPGAKFTAESDVTLDPLYMDMTMADGASVRTATPAGLRFTTTISEPHYQSLLAAGADFELGTIIVPTEDITGEFTYAAITGEGRSCLKIPCKIFWGHNETERTYTGVISNLYEENYNRDFSARAYISVTYTDGSSQTFYSAFDKTANTRSTYGVACAALADKASALSEDAKAVLQNYFDVVGVNVSFTVPEVGAAPDYAVSNIQNGYYTVKSEWECQFETKVPTVFMNDKGYIITITIEAKEGVTITEDTAILLNGSTPKVTSYTITDGVLTIVRKYPLGDYTMAY